MVHLRSPNFRVVPRSAAILTWRIQLDHGNLQKLAMVDGDFQIPHMSMSPGTRISLLDAYNNACFDHELENLTMVIEKTTTTSTKKFKSTSIHFSSLVHYDVSQVHRNMFVRHGATTSRRA
jgi:hypothetical protein